MNSTRASDLDNQIAEKFMGLQPWPNQNPWQQGRLFKSRPRVEGEPPRPIPAPEFSKKIAPAWRVLEKLNRMHPVAIRSDITGHWFVECGKVKASAPTAPLAICYAALASLEPPPPEDDEDF
jgi:hypothetical protein